MLRHHNSLLPTETHLTPTHFLTKSSPLKISPSDFKPNLVLPTVAFSPADPQDGRDVVAIKNLLQSVPSPAGRSTPCFLPSLPDFCELRMPVVALKNVRKSYQAADGKPLPILNIPRLEIESGEQVVLLGESGGGKTTLLNVISGITSADAGEVLIDGLNLVSLPEPVRDRIRARKIGIVFQTFNLLPAFSALENVLLGMSFAGTGVDRKRAQNLLERVGLGHRLHQSPSRLSVGEQQRVAVARALANKPAVLLADEPTASVDPANQSKVLDIIRETCTEEHCALILVTHSLEVSGQFQRVEQLKNLNQLGGAA